jgi:hypothetical protein
MMTITEFKKVCGLETIKLYKGKGREFGETPIGKVFVGDSTDWSKDVFVMAGSGKTKTGDSLVGTYWFVNSSAQLSREV